MKRAASLILLATIFVRCSGDETTVREQNAPVQNTSSRTDRLVQRVESPAPEGAAEPFLYASRDGVLLSWLEPVNEAKRFALRFARYADGRWSTPRTIVERDDLFVNWADFPSIVEDSRGTLFAHWLQKSGSGTYAYDVRMAISKDGGATWSQSFVLNRDGKKTEHGFVTLAALRGGGIGATWLDGRKMNPDAGHEHDGGDMTIRYASVTASGKIADDVELDDRACECCTTGMTVTSAGPVIAYRDRSAEEVRDISHVRRDGNGWSEPRPVNVDGWKINACPVNGPQLDAIGNRAVIAWFTAANEQQRVYAAFSDDGGATFGRPVKVDDGRPVGRVDVVMLEDGRSVVSWLEQTAAGAEIRVRQIESSGTLGQSVKVAQSSTARASGFTRMARAGSEVWFAWTEQDAKGKRVRLARGVFSVENGSVRQVVQEQ